MAPGPKKRLSAIILLLVAAALTAVSPGPARFDLNIGSSTGHALLSLGFATVRIAFDFEH